MTRIAQVRTHSRPSEISVLPSTKADATYEGGSAISTHEAAKSAAFLTYASACPQIALPKKM